MGAIKYYFLTEPRHFGIKNKLKKYRNYVKKHQQLVIKYTVCIWKQSLKESR